MTHYEGSRGLEFASSDEIGEVFTTMRGWLVRNGRCIQHSNGPTGDWYMGVPVAVESDRFSVDLSAGRLQGLVPEAAATLEIGGNGITFSYAPPHAQPTGVAGLFDVLHGEVSVLIRKPATSPLNLEVLLLIREADGTYRSSRDTETRRASSSAVSQEAVSSEGLSWAALSRAVEAHQLEEQLGVHYLTRPEYQALMSVADRLDELTAPGLS